MSSSIQPRYLPRTVRFHRLESIDGWRLKVYGLSMPGQDARPALVDATLALAREHLPRPAVTADRYGVGLVIAHDAMASSIGLVYWWQSGNELHQRVFAGPQEDPRAMSRIAEPAAGCVFELGIVDFERRAWIDDVLSDERGQDVDRYLSRRFEGAV